MKSSLRLRQDLYLGRSDALRDDALTALPCDDLDRRHAVQRRDVRIIRRRVGNLVRNREDALDAARRSLTAVVRRVEAGLGLDRRRRRRHDGRHVGRRDRRDGGRRSGQLTHVKIMNGLVTGNAARPL